MDIALNDYPYAKRVYLDVLLEGVPDIFSSEFPVSFSPLLPKVYVDAVLDYGVQLMRAQLAYAGYSVLGLSGKEGESGICSFLERLDAKAMDRTVANRLGGAILSNAVKAIGNNRRLVFALSSALNYRMSYGREQLAKKGFVLAEIVSDDELFHFLAGYDVEPKREDYLPFWLL